MHVRYWGTIAFNSINSKIGTKAKDGLLKTNDTSPSVRIEAANILMKIGEINRALPVLIKELEHENLIVVTHSIPLNFLERKQLMQKKPCKCALNGLIKSDHLIFHP